jgi:DnaJ-class molecular chaperone
MTRLPFDRAVDYYRVLGVKSNATAEEIHATYRRLARAYHPDCYPGSKGALVRMARVNVAKSVLLDPNPRAAYDQSGSRVHGPAVPAVQRRTATWKGGRRFDYTTAIMLAIVAPLMVALLLYAVSGVQLAACPVPFLAC